MTASMLPVRNPRTGEYDYEMPVTSADDIQSIAARLRAAQMHWYALGVEGRAEVLNRFADSVTTELGPLAQALSVDTGRTTFAHFEAMKSVELIRMWAERAGPILQDLAGSGQSGQVPAVHYQHRLIPYQMVAVISPWNVPLLLAMIDSLAALAAGCAVLLKPSEVTPRFIQPLQRALDAVPELAAVLHIVTGGPDTGKAMIEEVDAVCFTGSVKTGRQVSQQAAACFIPAFLELGGKDPAVILHDADVPLAVRAIIRSAMGMTGQACQSLERIYCHESISEAVTDELLRQLSELSLTCSEDGAGDIAPLIFERQVDTIQAQVDDALAKGATCLLGGEPVRAGGIWYPPTLLTNVNHTMLIMQEETFGPVIPVVVFSDAEEAVALANDSKFGLSAAVFSQDTQAAMAVAERLQVGAISINDASLTGIVNDVEKNSFRFSGMGGSRMGPAGLIRFLRKRALLIQTGEPAPVQLFSDTPLSDTPQETAS
ncbi:MAG: aldehyde dehydrogenase family protein [Luminiphilus sp.]|nr:aldehyde dehydrogenase family protein [Luminiphilus sp.]MDG2036674.1 aldehyde dehydrogenase family protein [Luminiphilus sp.]